MSVLLSYNILCVTSGNMGLLPNRYRIGFTAIKLHKPGNFRSPRLTARVSHRLVNLGSLAIQTFHGSLRFFFCHFAIIACAALTFSRDHVPALS
jgi:hypothetical protein